MAMRKVVYFLSFLEAEYSRSSTLLNASSELFEKKFIKIRPGIFNSLYDLNKYKRILKGADTIVIMSPCHILAIFAWLFTRKTLVLDAGWPLIDGILSRRIALRNPIRFLATYFIDFWAMHLSQKVLIETNQQSHRVRKLFLLPQKKLEVIFTGLNEKPFEGNFDLSELTQEIKSRVNYLNNGITVIFRGKINNEAGFQNILSVAKEMEESATFIFVVGRNDREIRLSKNVIYAKDVSFKEMAYLYNLADVALGQLSDHPRLDYTIPHKAFEAGYFSVPYITSASKGICELYGDDCATILKKISVDEIVSAIVTSDKLKSTLSKKIKTRYDERACQRVLNSKFENIVANIN